jgi:hypothetical protein
MNYHRTASCALMRMAVGALITNPIVSMVQCGARPSRNCRCASQETRPDMITATATMIIREGNLFRLMNPEQRERLFSRYRSTYAGRQCTAGDSVAADMPFLPWRSGLWNRRCPGFRIDLAEFMPKAAVQLENNSGKIIILI